MTTRRKLRVPPPDATVEPLFDSEMRRIVQHPDGYYWVSEDNRHETGPFATLEDAVADLMRPEELETEPGETLQEAEAEIGIADWIDPETSAPAEEERPRLEEH